ncbi:hypothetical protein GGI07_001596 [Coemansia sp. Benny D115]|nr:hypothetical protein GGI07_001596 [Coemansia sp. Benny D115]
MAIDFHSHVGSIIVLLLFSNLVTLVVLCIVIARKNNVHALQPMLSDILLALETKNQLANIKSPVALRIANEEPNDSDVDVPEDPDFAQKIIQMELLLENIKYLAENCIRSPGQPLDIAGVSVDNDSDNDSDALVNALSINASE